MATDLIHDRGRGTEIVGTRITVYNLLPYFLDSTATETGIAELYGLTIEQVAAARAYALNHADAVLARHGEIEARLARGNPPELVEQLKSTHARLLQFKEWRSRRDEADAAGTGRPSGFPTFDEWLTEQSMNASERR
ncbi:MAG: DUF433 domain-containing protein [Pirellulales bacterium]